MKHNFVWFDDREVLEYLKSDHGRNNLLPAVSVACSPKCNMACPHCIYDAGSPGKEGLTKEEKLSLLERAAGLGAQYLQICHEGEPFMDSATLPLIRKASQLGMRTFMYTNAAEITLPIARTLYENGVCLGVKCDSMDADIFNQMLGCAGAGDIYRGIKNLLEAGYRKPHERHGKPYTKLCLVCTLTSTNLESARGVARFCWNNNIFFGVARLERGGRAVGRVWETFRIPEQKKVEELIDWCSAQTGINYWNAQPKPYCIGVCGMQIADNGRVWITEYGGSCDFTEPDGESYPEDFEVVGNVKKEALNKILAKLWQRRNKLVGDGALKRKMAAYEKTKDVYPNGLQDCGSARTYTLFKPFYEYVVWMCRRNDFNKKIEELSR